MNAQEIRSIVLEVLTDVAPEIDPATVKADIDLREQFDIDSMDFLNFLIGLSKRFQVDVPEADYGKLATLDACVAYIVAHADK
jgi:acyl carrier protein